MDNIKTCPDGKILNPATNRCVKKDGPTAKKLYKSKSVEKTCGEGKILNPKTGRCIKADGALAIKLKLNKKADSNSPFVPNYDEIAHDQAYKVLNLSFTNDIDEIKKSYSYLSDKYPNNHDISTAYFILTDKTFKHIYDVSKNKQSYKTILMAVNTLYKKRNN